MDWTFGIFSYFTVWILSLLLFYGGSSNAAPAPKPGEDNMLGDYGDLYGTGRMANHVPRLGRRSLRPFSGGERYGGDRNLAGLYGPLFNRYENFRYYGGRPGEELARGLLRDKRQQEEYSELLSLQADKADIGKSLPADATKTKTSEPDIDQDFWKNVIGEATINSVLEKMEEIGETREIIEDFNQYKAFGVGNPVPKYLAHWGHPVNSPPKVSAPQTPYPNAKAMLNKYKSYFPKGSIDFPRRKKGRTFTRIFSRR